MSDAKNKDLIKLISEILEYTENPTPSDSPTPPPDSPTPPPSDSPTSSRSKCPCSAGGCLEGSSSAATCPDGAAPQTCSSAGEEGQDCEYN